MLEEWEKPSSKIMAVDDTPENLALLREMLTREGWEFYAFPDGKMALKAAEKNPPDLVLMDVSMPDMDGYEVCKRLKEIKDFANIPVIFLSALSGTRDKLRAFQSGGVDYITKPFQPDEVRARVSTHLTLKALREKLEYQNRNLSAIVKKQVREISESQSATILALAKLAEYRDEDTGMHLERVSEFCSVLAAGLLDRPERANALTVDMPEVIRSAAPLHDIGKVAIPDAILLKPGRLTADEFEIMKKHTLVGASTLLAVNERYRNNEMIRMGIDVALYHHERWDGKGYPHGLAGEAIPISARIMSVADVYDALRSNRCYRKSIPHETVVEMIMKESGTQFDPVILEVFLERIDVFVKTSYTDTIDFTPGLGYMKV